MKSHNLLFATLSFAVFCGASAVAQQNSSTAASPQHQKLVRVNEFHVDAGGEPGRDMGPGFGPRGGPNFGPPGMWWKNPEIAQKLSLTADQQKKMDDIFQQSRLQLIDLKANVEKQELLLEPMLSANPPDTNKVLAQIDHVAAARAELEKGMARMLLNIRGVLSADQWTKLQSERPRFRQRPDGPDGPGGPGFGPGGPSGPRSNGFKGHGGPGAPVSSLTAPALPGVPVDAAAEVDFDI
jgi:Spy/CpxP family protein refolding chaperone